MVCGWRSKPITNHSVIKRKVNFSFMEEAAKGSHSAINQLKNQSFPFQQFSSFLMAHSGPTKRRVAEWACRAAGPLGEPFHSFSCMPLIDCLLLSATTNQLTYFASFISLIVFSGPPINLFHFFQSIHLLIRELMKKWEIVGPLYSNRPTSTNQKLFNNFIVLIY